MGEKIKAQKLQAEQEFTELKNLVSASGIGGTELNREIYDKLDDDILAAKQRLKVNKSACERLENVLVAVRQGATGLTQRLQPFQGLLTYDEELELPRTGIDEVCLLARLCGSSLSLSLFLSLAPHTPTLTSFPCSWFSTAGHPARM